MLTATETSDLTGDTICTSPNLEDWIADGSGIKLSSRSALIRGSNAGTTNHTLRTRGHPNTIVNRIYLCRPQDGTS